MSTRGSLAAAMAFAMAACASLPPSSRASRTVVVDAEGWAADDPADPAAARARALAQAEKQAVEEAAGVSLSARTRLENGRLKDQVIDAAASGRVARYRITAERRQDGFFRLRIHATIQLGARTCPSISLGVAIAGSNDGSWGREAGDVLRRKLLAGGCRIVETTRQPDLLISGRASAASFQDGRVVPFSSSRASLAVEAVDSSGAVVWQDSRQAAALGSDEDAAALRAVAQAAALAGDAALEALSDGRSQ